MVLKKASRFEYWWVGASLGPFCNFSDLPIPQLQAVGGVEA